MVDGESLRVIDHLPQQGGLRFTWVWGQQEANESHDHTDVITDTSVFTSASSSPTLAQSRHIWGLPAR